jgi:ribonucleoside-diphosphate reductase alpha chain
MQVAKRESLPRRRAGHTTSVTIGGESLRITASGNAGGHLCEIIIHWGKQGATTAGLMDAYAVALSAGLQHHVPLAELLAPGLDLHCAPSGRTDDPDIPRARSVFDYTARRLALDWLPYRERAAMGIYSMAERMDAARPWLHTQDALFSRPQVLDQEAAGILWELATSVRVPAGAPGSG